LCRVFGPPGGGKTFWTLDVSLHVALNREWCGRRIHGGPVVYVAAEGVRVNRDRVSAWLDYHKVKPERLVGRLVTVPHAVLLTPPAMTDFLHRVEGLRPVLVVLDTKNAMQVGEENSASDTAVMRRALDAIRTTGDACVTLIDHTGHGNDDRARGSSAVTAAMDTEIKVTKDDRVITATVTRDKANEAGMRIHFDLERHAPAAVLRWSRGKGGSFTEGDWWRHPIPAELSEVTGAGAKHVPAMARYLAWYALGDTGRLGMTRAEAIKALGLSAENGQARAAWSQLIEGRWIQRADGVTSDTSRHVWSGRETS
jgi:hypothetical protein